MAILQRDLRASDRDREQAVARLKAHYADGRLADHELAWRSEAAYRAIGVRELTRLTSDLPALGGVPRRRSHVLPIALLAMLVAAIAAWLVVVPPEVTVALVLVFVVLALLATVLLAPLWIPALLAFVAYRVIRARVRPR